MANCEAELLINLNFSKLSQKLIRIGLLLTCLWPAAVYSCTAFCMVQGNNVLVAKNLDWFVEDGIIIVNQRNRVKTALLLDSGIPLHWTSKYGCVTFNQFGREFPLGGMNEAGLVVEELSYALSEYPAPDHRATVNEFQWIQYQLDCYQSVAEVIQNVPSLRIAGLFAKLHYFIADRFGQAAVVEYLDGELNIYTRDQLPVAALTNNSYENLLKYLSLHQGFGGDMRLHPGPGSQERFVRVATHLKKQARLAERFYLKRVFNLLDSVKQDDTRWQLVYNPRKLLVYFRTQSDSSIRHLYFQDLDFTCGSSVQVAKINASTIRENKLKFEEYHESLNKELILSVFTQLMQFGEIGELPVNIIAGLSRYPESCNCLETH